MIHALARGGNTKQSSMRCIFTAAGREDHRVAIQRVENVLANVALETWRLI